MSKEELEMKLFGRGDGELPRASFAMSAISGCDHGRNWVDQSRATRAHDRIPAEILENHDCLQEKRLMMILMWKLVNSDMSTISFAGVQDFTKISGGQSLYANRRSANKTNKLLLQVRLAGH